MSIIKVFNSYFINDISKIIYKYYFDDSKIIQARKDFLIEYHKKVELLRLSEFVKYNGIYICLRSAWYHIYSTSNNRRITIDTIFRFDKKDENNKYIVSGPLPNNYIIWDNIILNQLTNHRTQWINEWVNRQRLLKNRFEVK